MLNDKSVQAVAEARWSPAPNSSAHFIRPLYESYCFSNILPTIQHLLTGTGTPALPSDVWSGLEPRYDTVILFFVDALGWRFFDRHAAAHPFLKRVLDEGIVSKLTSQFPSTTAAHVTHIHTGLTSGASGVFEWFYYEPQLDMMIAPMLFSPAGPLVRERLRPTGIDPAKI